MPEVAAEIEPEELVDELELASVVVTLDEITFPDPSVQTLVVLALFGVLLSPVQYLTSYVLQSVPQ